MGYDRYDYNRRYTEQGRPNKKIIAATIIALIICFAFAVNITTPLFAKKGVLIVGTNTPFPPFEDDANGEIIGFDIDLARLIAKDMGMTLKVVNFRDFYALFPALGTGEIDMIASSVTITPERKEAFNFSIPYYTANQAALTQSDSMFKCSSVCKPSDFEGFVVGFQAQTTSEAWAKKNLSNETKTHPQSDLATLLLLLKNRTIDVVIVDGPVANAYAKADTEFKVAGEIKTDERYGFVVQRGDPNNMLQSINNTIDRLIQSGEYDSLIQKWFA